MTAAMPSSLPDRDTATGSPPSGDDALRDDPAQDNEAPANAGHPDTERDDVALNDVALNDVALDWFVRRRRQGTPADDAAFMDWLDQDPSHRLAYDRHQQDWDALDALPAAGIAQLRADLARDLRARMASDVRVDTAGDARADTASGARVDTASDPWASPRSSRRSSYRARDGGWRAWLIQGAVAFALVLGCGGGYLAWDHWQRQPVFTQQFASARGQQLDITLPDGSRLRLDTATRAEVSLYRTRREVRLPEGQAVFQVQKDPARPFDVLAGPLKVTVIGTRFSVRHTPGTTQDGSVRVAVEEGRVRVARAHAGTGGGTNAVSSTGTAPGDTSGDGGGPSGNGGTALDAASSADVIELGAGQQVVSDAHGRFGSIAQVAAAGIAPWREGRISFQDTPLSAAIAEFERYGPTNLVIPDPEVGALRLTGTFDPLRTGNFKLALPRVLPVQLRAQGDIIEIVRR